MNVKLRSISIATSLGLLLAITPFAKADTINASVWANGTAGNSVAPAGNPVYGTTPTTTLTITNSDPSAILNFYSPNASGTNYSLTSFLTTGTNGLSNGDTITFLTGGDQSSINNDLFQFTGTVTLTDGTYTYEHDDGMVLYLNGSAVITDPGPTAATPTSFTVCATGCNATAGTYDFTLDYAEVEGPPAVLQGNLPFASATPEPSSFVLLGSGLLGAAGMLRRRMKKS